jgi:hypothetical protein
MSERIYKLQPNRTLALRGFDNLGAAAALHSATADSFKVSGVFRDPSDFAVLMLHDADNFYEHPRLKHLPDFRFDGLTLSFDVRYTGLMPIDSPKYATIDWPYLDYILKDETTGRVPLFPYVTQVGGDYKRASTSIKVVSDAAKQFDRLTLWYLNLAYDYLVPKVECAFFITGFGPGHIHKITVAGQTYSYTEKEIDGNAGVAAGLAALLSAGPDVSASVGTNTPETGPVNQLNIRAKRGDNSTVEVSWTSETHTLTAISAATIAQEFARQINTTDWATAGSLFPLEATSDGDTLRIVTTRPGVDGNMLSMYAVSKNSRLTTSSPTIAFTGGSSDATWRVTLDFQSLGLSEVRTMWFTYAPPLANGQPFQDTEWEAVYTNWTLTGPEERRVLKVAGPNSIRIEENDSWCKYSGTWTDETGFFSDGFAKHSNTPGSSVTIRYTCQTVHDLYLGTSLYTDRGAVAIQLDGDAETTLNTAIPNEPSVNTRRVIRAAVPAGDHSVQIRVVNSGHFYFDFLEAVVATDVPEPLAARDNISPALDYSTDHTYKLSPSRLLWIFDNLGYTGPMNEYIGVFWWNQRKRVNAVIPSATATFGGEFAAGDQVFLNIGGQPCGKTVFAGDTPSVVAKHFECFINANYVGVWARAEANVLTVTSHSPAPAYAYSFTGSVERASGSTGAVAVSGELKNGQEGTWIVDPDQSPALNRGAQAWHRDFFAQCAARNRELVVASSMELVNPPDGFGAVYPDDRIVETDVGFASMKSTHCAFVDVVRNYQAAVFTCIAGWMQEAGLTPNVQTGEYLWWFFTNKTESRPNGGMALYHPEIKAAAQAALGRPLRKFEKPTDDPTVNAGADAVFLRNRLRDHVAQLIQQVRAVVPSTKFELLFPYDVNHPEPAGIHSLGGPLNRFLNLPVEWETKETSPFDRIKMEALDFGAWSRNLDLARTAIEFPLALGWPRDSVRHLVPVFRCGYAWEKEIDMARAAGIPSINLWAFDHVCIYGLPSTPAAKGRSMRF